MRVVGTTGDHEWARRRYREVASLRFEVFSERADDDRAHYHGRVDLEHFKELGMDARDLLLVLDDGYLLYGGSLRWGRDGEFWVAIDLG